MTGAPAGRSPGSSAPDANAAHAADTGEADPIPGAERVKFGSAWPRLAIRLVIIGVIALALGVLTAYAQGWLPDQASSAANSVGTWALIAFLLALLAGGVRSAAVAGAIALLGLLGGYVMGAAVRGYSSGLLLIVFWAIASVTAGPVLGLSAQWIRSVRGWPAAIGAGLVSGLLIGEGWYGLAVISGTTYPPYWWGEAAAGLVLLAMLSAFRLRRWSLVGLAVAMTAVVAVAFVVVYQQNLFTIYG
jgi:uncharacterized protein DUF6518